jgi:hypothetical protein
MMGKTSEVTACRALGVRGKRQEEEPFMGQQRSHYWGCLSIVASL